ncbi:hypothetical protein [Frankia sp. R82]|uniref:hypothetical protein n=1 Tax=Frankia sp. R82 TaxID=2950553 RepID=UPI0020447CE8|nr:hypothetical protein [Frankia sp. R82]MCM3882907.1 hypothetical protein [Frankia sp. R82]
MAREVISIVNVWCDNGGRHPHERAAATTSAAFAFDGQLVRLDLCAECRDELSSVLGEYAEFGEATPLARGARLDTTWSTIEENDATNASEPAPATSAGSAPRTRKPAAAASASASAAEDQPRRPHQIASTNEVRAWLRDHAGEYDAPVPSRGARLSADQKAAYDQAHGWAQVDGTWRPAAPSDGDAPARTGAEATETADAPSDAVPVTADLAHV